MDRSDFSEARRFLRQGQNFFSTGGRPFHAPASMESGYLQIAVVVGEKHRPPEHVAPLKSQPEEFFLPTGEQLFLLIFVASNRFQRTPRRNERRFDLQL